MYTGAEEESLIYYATIMGNAGEALDCGNSYCRSTPVSQRADQAWRLSPLCWWCNLSSALCVQHLCQAELFSWAGAGADRRAFQPERKQPVAHGPQ